MLKLLFILSPIFTFAYSFTDFTVAYKEALKNGKHIVIDAGQPWCAPCIAYKKEFIPSPHIKHVIKNQLIFIHFEFEDLAKDFDRNNVPKDCNLNPLNQSEKSWKTKLHYCLQMHNSSTVPVIAIMNPKKEVLKEIAGNFWVTKFDRFAQAEFAEKIKKSFYTNKKIKFKDLK